MPTPWVLRAGREPVPGTTHGRVKSLSLILAGSSSAIDMASARMPAAETVRELALGAGTTFGSSPVPSIRFPSADKTCRNESTPVPFELRAGAASLISEAYRWAGSRFCFALPSAEPSRCTPAILGVEVYMGRSRQLYSESSTRRAGTVTLASAWPVGCRYELGSLLVHEAVHQGLFLRERQDTPVRSGALGYAPWRCSTRTGRRVWHGFWTFACQVAVLVDAVDDCPTLLGDNPNLADLLSRLEPRVHVCLNAIETFRIVHADELDRCRSAAALIAQQISASESAAALDSALERQRSVALDEYREWATSTILHHSGGAHGRLSELTVGTGTGKGQETEL